MYVLLIKGFIISNGEQNLIDIIQPLKSIWRRYLVSTSTVTRVLSYLSVEKKSLPKVLLIDEFKGDSGSYKYQCSHLDGVTHEIIDIVRSRQENILLEYFKNIPKKERDNVKIFVSDMSKTFKMLRMNTLKMQCT